MATLRRRALEMLGTVDPDHKAAATRALEDTLAVGAQEPLVPCGVIPGRPERPLLVPHTALTRRSMHTRDGRAALIHALAHIELNAIDLALDICWRFGGMPDDFYRQWMGVAREEARHFELLRDHLASFGVRYGDLPAHNALWEMAERTRGDLLARLALVARTAAARGLDASPPLIDKLRKSGDEAGVRILEIILHDEIGHVAVGNHWFHTLCAEQGLDPVQTQHTLARQYDAPRPRGPFNVPARRAAGFTPDEIEALMRPT